MSVGLGMRVAVVAFLVLGLAASAQNIEQARGADQGLDYRSLTKFGPWDDRNYQLTQKDLALLAPNEEELIIPIPAFFRVELRKRIPTLSKEGPIQYPRAAVPLFQLEYQGLMVDGRIAAVEDKEADEKVAVPVSGEIKLNTLLGANEITIEINPVFPDHVIAGANNNSGQEMYYSDNGGQT